MSHFTPVMVMPDRGSIPRAEAVAVEQGRAGSYGPFGEARWIQVHGVSDARVEYVVAPPVGTSPGVSPDRQQLPSQREPILIPLGAVLTIVNVGAGTRAFTLVSWPY